MKKSKISRLDGSGRDQGFGGGSGIARGCCGGRDDEEMPNDSYLPFIRKEDKVTFVIYLTLITGAVNVEIEVDSVVIKLF